MKPLTEGLNPPLFEQDEPTYRCPDCLDVAYVTREGVKGSKGRRVRCLVAAWCDCHAGRAACAGYWFDQVYQAAGPSGRRVKSARGEAALREYLADNPLKGRWLPDAVEQLRKRYEEQRKRKLNAIEGES